MLNHLCRLFCCCLIFGCGAPQPYDVRAVVRLDGKPLAGAIVTFLPDREKASSAFGITDEEGSVTFNTTTSDGEVSDGVLPGSYIVIVSKAIEEKKLTNNEIRALAETGIRYSPNVVEFVPEKYPRRESSDFRVKVGYWRSTEFVFDLQ